MTSKSIAQRDKMEAALQAAIQASGLTEPVLRALYTLDQWEPLDGGLWLIHPEDGSVWLDASSINALASQAEGHSHIRALQSLVEDGRARYTGHANLSMVISSETLEAYRTFSEEHLGKHANWLYWEGWRATANPSIHRYNTQEGS